MEDTKGSLMDLRKKKEKQLKIIQEEIETIDYKIATLEKTIEKTIINSVCKVFGVNYDSIKSGIREQHFVRARHALAHLLALYTQLKLIEIARLIGVTDHSTVVYGKKKAQHLLKKDKTFMMSIAECKDLINEIDE